MQKYCVPRKYQKNWDRKPMNVTNDIGLHSGFLTLTGSCSLIFASSLIELPGEVEREHSAGTVFYGQFANAIYSGTCFVGIEAVIATDVGSKCSESLEME